MGVGAVCEYYPDQVHMTRWALDEAFARARARGYRPGSLEMQALDSAEQAYRRARRRREALQTAGPTDRPPSTL